MAKPTNPRQPVIYDMMLLAHALIRLADFERRRVGIGHNEFCDRQIVFEHACTKVRTLAQFISGSGDNNLIRITDPEFNGVPEKQFIRDNFDVISRYVSHLGDQRYIKDPKYPRPVAKTILTSGKTILDYLKPLMDGIRGQLRGDAKRWYSMFEKMYQQL